MSKNKRKNKKRRVAQSNEVSAPVAEQTVDATPHPQSDYKTAVWGAIVVIATIIAVYAMIANHSGGIGGQVSNNSSDQTPSQTGLPGVQSNNSNALSPSGSVDLQPTSNAAQAGSVQ